jgi:hypothetical protein
MIDLTFSLNFVLVIFYVGGGDSSPRPTLRLGDQVISFSLGYQLSDMGVPTSSYTTAGIALGIMTKQTPPLLQGTGTFGWGILL